MMSRGCNAWGVGFAALLTLGSTPMLLAQTDTLTRRVPIRKEQAARVPVTKEPVVAPTDTVRRVSGGEVVKPTEPPVPATSPTRLDSAIARPAATPVAPPQAQPPARKASRYLFGNSGFYVGIAAGTAVPYNELSDIGYDSGFDLTIPIGWHRAGQTLGLRGTLGLDQLHADPNGPLPALLGSGPDPKIYTATLDATVNFPIGRSAREGHGLTLYALGGGGAYLFRGFGGSTQLGDVLGTDKVGSSAKNVHKWGVDAGAGMEYGLGPAAIFVEARWVNVFTNGSRAGNDYVRWIPIAVGVTIR